MALSKSLQPAPHPYQSYLGFIETVLMVSWLRSHEKHPDFGDTQLTCMCLGGGELARQFWVTPDKHFPLCMFSKRGLLCLDSGDMHDRPEGSLVVWGNDLI